MFKKYDIEIGKYLSEEKNLPWNDIWLRHKRMIARIQHERLVHLLVTIFVGTVMAISFMSTIIFEKSLLLLFDIPLLFLFVGYLFHYRFLENTTQKWYGYEELLETKLAQAKTK